MSNFITLYSAGNVLEDDIDDFVANWHQTETGMPLNEYLGMSRPEYALWVADPDVLPFIADARRQQRDVSAVIEDFHALPLAARAASPQKARELMIWMKQSGLWGQ